MTELLAPHDHAYTNLAPGVALTETGAVIAPNISLDAWGGALQTCQAVANASAWALGDLLVFADDHGGWGEAASQYLDLTEKSFSTLQKAIYLARQYPPAERLPGLSWSHHAEVAAIKDPDERTALLLRARDEGWSREHLRAYRTETRGTIGKPRPAQTCPACGHQW